MLHLIAALLLLIAGLLIFLVFKVRTAFRNLSSERMGRYTAHLSHLHEWADALRHNQPHSVADSTNQHALELIASFPTLRASTAAQEKLLSLARLKTGKADFSQVSAAEQAMEKALVDLNVAMRDDLALNFGDGRFPNAEAFRSMRKRDV